MPLHYTITGRRPYRRDLAGQEWDVVSVEWTHPDGRELHPGGPCPTCGQHVAGSPVVLDEVPVLAGASEADVEAAIEAKHDALAANLGVD